MSRSLLSMLVLGLVVLDVFYIEAKFFTYSVRLVIIIAFLGTLWSYWKKYKW